MSISFNVIFINVYKSEKKKRCTYKHAATYVIIASYESDPFFNEFGFNCYTFFNAMHLLIKNQFIDHFQSVDYGSVKCD